MKQISKTASLMIWITDSIIYSKETLRYHEYIMMICWNIQNYFHNILRYFKTKSEWIYRL
jgi:uncharacterized protein (DUF486 family)